MSDRVEVRMGYTRNMGSFESMRIDVGISSDARDSETIQQAYDRVYKFVEERLLEDFEATEEELREARAAEKKRAREG